MVPILPMVPVASQMVVDRNVRTNSSMEIPGAVLCLSILEVNRMSGRGRMGGSGLGPGGECRCPNCGYTMPHQTGVPCYQQTCPKCGSKMVRA
ncbi:MAG: hypothetical protein ACXQTW_06520 [Candidatus Methanospirareceae archaeon]